MKTFNISGKDFKCISLRDLAKYCERKSCTLRKLEQLGILPPANIRTGSIVIKNGAKVGEERVGYRYYTYSLAVKLAKIFKEEIHQGVPISAETKNKLIVLFNEELKEIKNAQDKT